MDAQEIITYSPATVSFPGYETAKAQCLELAHNVAGMIVTEDTVKAVKKDLADARKIVTALEDRRKALKKEILKPYTVLEGQIKELVAIVDDADSVIRSQVKELEEQDRQKKQDAIYEIWNKRIEAYGNIRQYIPDAFELFMIPQYLNKTTAISSVEKEMASFLEKVDAEITAILKFDNASDILAEYSCNLNLAAALDTVKAREDYKASLEDPEEDLLTEEHTQMFLVTGEKDIKFAEMLLDTNNINYKKITFN